MMRTSVIALASLLAFAPTIDAQRPGAVEVSLFGNYSWFDNQLTLKDQWGGGFMLGVYLLPQLALEAEGRFTPSERSAAPQLGADVNTGDGRARLTFAVPLGGNASALLLGAGYVRTNYREAYDFGDNGITGLAGFRIGLTPAFAFRAAGTLDYAPDPSIATIDHYWNWGVQAGFSFLLNNKYDNDHDKIADKKDKCPATPKDAQVDAAGCAATQRDTDLDKVADASDLCPSTTAGQSVDPKGCSAEQRDTDRDKVADASDKCPNTPAGETPNATGCAKSEMDSDGDGVMDLADRCAGSDRGPAVDAEGCSSAQRDGDKDGVMDVADRCTSTPAGEKVDANGCPVDADGDGIADAGDKCPGSAAGKEVDETGCTRLFRGGERTLVLYGAQFETGKAVLTEGSQGALKDVAQALAAHPDVKVEVAGFTDNTGSAAVNKRLSKERADAVMQYLIQNGAAGGQLTAKGYGPANPLASNATADGRAKNRRVELRRVVE